MIAVEQSISAAHQFTVWGRRHGAIAHLFDSLCCSYAALVHDKSVARVFGTLTSGERDVDLVDRSNLFCESSDVLLSAGMTNVSYEDLQHRFCTYQLQRTMQHCT
jgi:hypothetical protein